MSLSFVIFVLNLLGNIELCVFFRLKMILEGLREERGIVKICVFRFGSVENF